MIQAQFFTNINAKGLFSGESWDFFFFNLRHLMLRKFDIQRTYVSLPAGMNRKYKLQRQLCATITNCNPSNYILSVLPPCLSGQLYFSQTHTDRLTYRRKMGRKWSRRLTESLNPTETFTISVPGIPSIDKFCVVQKRRHKL